MRLAAGEPIGAVQMGDGSGEKARLLASTGPMVQETETEIDLSLLALLSTPEIAEGGKAEVYVGSGGK